jgi:nucleoporin NUP82
MALIPLDASEYSDDWSSLLKAHPIFSSSTDTTQSQKLELSTNSLPDFTQLEPSHDSPLPSRRRQVMVLKDADLIVAIGKEIRVTSLADPKRGRATSKSYKARLTLKPCFVQS